jgi:hypothetical protein
MRNGRQSSLPYCLALPIWAELFTSVMRKARASLPVLLEYSSGRAYSGNEREKKSEDLLKA